MKVWIIEYCDADGNVRDCYPDFCYSSGEAYRIAPEFMAAMAACGPDGAWAKSWRIVEEEMPRTKASDGSGCFGPSFSEGGVRGSTDRVKEPWQMDPAEWDAVAKRGQIVQDQGPERDLRAVLSGAKPATDLDIHEGHPSACRSCGPGWII